MRVLQISPVAPPYRAGMANTAGEIFKATREAGISADLVAAFGESSIKNLKHFHFPGFGLMAFTPRLVSLCAEYDLIHLHYPCYGNAMMVALAQTLGNKKPLVVSYHMDTMGRGLRKPIFALHAKFFAPAFLRRTSAIVSASRDYAEHSLLAKHPDLMKKVIEIPFGIDTKRFCPVIPPPSPAPISPTVLSQTKNTPSNNIICGQEHQRLNRCGARMGEGAPKGRERAPKNIIFVGGLDEQHYFKGLHVLLAAIVKTPGARLTVVGSGNLVKFYARRAFDLGIDERVVFAGKVPDEELPGYYQNADVFCLPSLDRSEAFGMVVLEASASGLPAVVSDIPGVRTSIIKNETGLLVPPGDPDALASALNSIFGNEQLATRLGVAGREFAQGRSWKKCGEAYAELYLEVIKNYGRTKIS
jgi:glycosyltransferase involved in cell wall biosynthesis